MRYNTMKQQDDITYEAQNHESLSLWQAIRKWPRITLYCLALSMNLLVWGYDTGLVGSVSSMPEFQYAYLLFTITQ
jgi:hypothetical protein